MSNTKEWFRSSEMEYISIILQEHCAHRSLWALGRLGSVQLIDLNPSQTAIQRRFIHEVQRCEDLLKKLHFFNVMLEKYDINNNFHYDIDNFLAKMEQRGKETNSSSVLDELESLIDEKEKEVQQLNAFRVSLRSDYNYQLELKHVLEKTRELTEGDVVSQSSAEIDLRPISEKEIRDKEIEGQNVTKRDESGLRFDFITGTLLTEDRFRFERMVFRATRGNCLQKFVEIDDLFEDENGEMTVKKTVFVIFFQSQYIEQKVRRICEAFSATLYQVPNFSNFSSDTQFRKEYEKVNNDLADRMNILAKNKNDMEVILGDLCKWLQVWDWAVKMEKAVFVSMNLMAVEVKGVLRAEGWVIKTEREKVQQVILANSTATGTGFGSVTTLPQTAWPSMPPTHFETNKFTSAFQLIVDTYGVPRYREANPAVFTVITFPFLFGVMFGDIGHGFLLFLVSCLVIYKEKELGKLKLDEMSGVVYHGRYFLVLMGFFSFYAGLLYNDYFAMGLRLFPVTWQIQDETYAQGDVVTYVPNDEKEVYPLGIDPTWHHAENGLLFFNSVKMKMSVIFGVTQMTMGIVLKLFNGIHFRSKVDVFFEALPQLIFMLSLFGYMCFLIIYKWAVDWGDNCSRAELNCNPPSLITTLINIALKIGEVEKDSLLYENQANVQTALLLIAVIMIPLMLIPKPMILARKLKESHSLPRSPRNTHDRESESVEPMLNGQDSELNLEFETQNAAEEIHSASDLWIHQGIETIEFCLGCISNTASYLRLWALSLAHSQLGTVFLEKALLDQITNSGVLGVIITFLGYGAFAGITFAVLMIMDNLECFLHALRLHWVEFQSKFYKADGTKFLPMDFRTMLKNSESLQE